MGDYDDDMPSLPASAGSPPQPETAQDLMSEVLEGAGADATALAKIAARYGLREDDPAWLVALAVRDATAAGVVAAEAAGRIESATRAVADQVFQQAQLAGADIAAAAGQAIEQKTLAAGSALVQVIKHSAGEGAAALKAAAMSLPAAAAGQRDAILADWKAALGATAAQEAATRARHGEWKIMGGIALGMALMAAAGGYVGRALAKAWPAASPPATVARFKNETEFQWSNVVAFTPGNCPRGMVCLVLRR
ncbi:hypothetical protein [Acidiferrobacter sp.]|uniref:hypothetical protein n=1 Tax=Acidiferrobacter sp. TaxID=1872107 RepID=UPI0026068F78|nr:hypothetical protein [Acidiferrobacter sp.]